MKFGYLKTAIERKLVNSFVNESFIYPLIPSLSSSPTLSLDNLSHLLAFCSISDCKSSSDLLVSILNETLTSAVTGCVQ